MSVFAQTGRAAEKKAMRIRESAGDRAFLIGIYVFLGLILVAIAYPLIYIVSSSFSSPFPPN